MTFKRFNFTSKLFSITSLAVLGLLAGPLAQGSSALKPELKSSFKQDVLELINRDRVAHGLRPVLLDPHASELGDRYCESQIQNKTTGHFTTDGVAPYMRYSFAGGNDGVSENAAAWSANYKFADSTILDMIRRSHRTMMLEVAPNDGHRRTLLDPDATHVGIGLAWEEGEFRMVQEFVRRYVVWNRTPPREVSTSDQPLLEGKPLAGYRVDAVSVYFEGEPQPLSAFVASRIDSYRLPKQRRDYLPQKIDSLRLASSKRTRGVAHALRRSEGEALQLRPDGSFSFIPSLSEGAGIYTIVVWVKSSDTAPAIAASNISLRVKPNASQPLRMLGTN